MNTNNIDMSSLILGDNISIIIFCEKYCVEKRSITVSKLSTIIEAARNADPEDIYCVIGIHVFTPNNL